MEIWDQVEQKGVELVFFLRVEIEVCNQYTQKDNVLVAFEKVILYLFFHASKSDQNYDHRDQEIELTLD